MTTTFGNAGGSGRNPFTTMQRHRQRSDQVLLPPPADIGGAQTCNGANAANLNQIFKDVGIDITGTRLISNP